MTPATLKHWRELLRLSQSEAAERLGVSQRTVRNWEAGEVRIPLTAAYACSAILFNLPPYGSEPTQATTAPRDSTARKP